jgi:hypothetical protein
MQWQHGLWLSTEPLAGSCIMYDTAHCGMRILTCWHRHRVLYVHLKLCQFQHRAAGLLFQKLADSAWESHDGIVFKQEPLSAAEKGSGASLKPGATAVTPVLYLLLHKVLLLITFELFAAAS